MKITQKVAYTALHYGRDYLADAIASVINAVDEYHVLYCPHACHSVSEQYPCPESRDELLSIAQHAAGDKLRWHDGDWRIEHQQRNEIYHLVEPQAAMLVVDADEVYAPGLAAHLFALAPFVVNRFTRVPMYHYWRSLRRVIRHDPAFPVRLIIPALQTAEGAFQIPPWMMDDFRIHHFGYAQRSEIVKYKMTIHGHVGQFREGWFENVFMANAQHDCHPIGSEWWNPVICDVPHFLAHHPYAALDVIP